MFDGHLVNLSFEFVNLPIQTFRKIGVTLCACSHQRLQLSHQFDTLLLDLVHRLHIITHRRRLNFWKRNEQTAQREKQRTDRRQLDSRCYCSLWLFFLFFAREVRRTVKDFLWLKRDDKSFHSVGCVSARQERTACQAKEREREGGAAAAYLFLLVLSRSRRNGKKRRDSSGIRTHATSDQYLKLAP